MENSELPLFSKIENLIVLTSSRLADGFTDDYETLVFSTECYLFPLVDEIWDTESQARNAHNFYVNKIKLDPEGFKRI